MFLNSWSSCLLSAGITVVCYLPPLAQLSNYFFRKKIRNVTMWSRSTLWTLIYIWLWCLLKRFNPFQYPGLLSTAVINTMTKINVGKKGVNFSLQVIVYHPRKLQQELKPGASSRIWPGNNMYWLLPGSCPATFSYTAQALGWQHPQWAEPSLQHELAIKRISHRYIHRSIWWGQFFSWEGTLLRYIKLTTRIYITPTLKENATLIVLF